MSAPKRVLVVEDDQDVSDAIAEALTEAGYAVQVAENGAVALAGLIRSADERPALLLLDLVMPVMDGRELLASLRSDASLASIPVVILTADVADVAEAEALGARAGVRKPVTREELLVVVATNVA